MTSLCPKSKNWRLRCEECDDPGGEPLPGEESGVTRGQGQELVRRKLIRLDEENICQDKESEDVKTYKVAQFVVCEDPGVGVA